MGGWIDDIAGPTLVVSLLSAVATGLVLVVWSTSAPNPARSAERNSLREALVLNLMVAEFINSVNNSISGIFVVISREMLPPGSSCNFNGWLGQVSVQASDFSVLAMALVTLFTFNYQSNLVNPPLLIVRLTCLSLWIIPLITGTIALALNKIEPASGNWCWIAEEPRYLRYVLGHGWRFAIFLTIILIYAYIFTRVSNRVRSRRRTNSNAAHDAKANLAPPFSPNVQRFNVEQSDGLQSLEKELCFFPSSSEKFQRSPSQEEFGERFQSGYGTRLAPQRPSSSSLRRGSAGGGAAPCVDQELRHWLLLAIYPATYIVVWTPGLANRLVELGGGSSHLLTVLQATTQSTGLVNALAYGFKELHGRVQRRERGWGFQLYSELYK